MFQFGSRLPAPQNQIAEIWLATDVPCITIARKHIQTTSNFVHPSVACTRQKRFITYETKGCCGRTLTHPQPHAAHGQKVHMPPGRNPSALLPRAAESARREVKPHRHHRRLLLVNLLRLALAALAALAAALPLGRRARCPPLRGRLLALRLLALPDPLVKVGEERLRLLLGRHLGGGAAVALLAVGVKARLDLLERGALGAH
mmetsp:Transcript_22734/g.74329  ORF Transcript_22734/g.74329 Transcript_22734/m.74329 type:complete len:203 (-) Transcript_22734:390-998(-)